MSFTLDTLIVVKTQQVSHNFTLWVRKLGRRQRTVSSKRQTELLSFKTEPLAQLAGQRSLCAAKRHPPFCSKQLAFADCIGFPGASKVARAPPTCQSPKNPSTSSLDHALHCVCACVPAHTWQRTCCVFTGSNSTTNRCRL